MVTILTDSPDDAAAVIRRGELVAFPTETVYGLGADALDTRAIARIFKAKRRPADNPLIVHVSRPADVKYLAAHVTEAGERLIEAFFPGPLTIIVERHKDVPAAASAGLETLAVRVPAHPVALEFLEACKTPVAAPSANLSGRPSPTTWQAVLEDLDGRIPCILRSDQSPVGLESSVVDCTSERPVLLRPGGIPAADLLSIVPTLIVGETDNVLASRSPGLKHRHYAPVGSVQIVADVPLAPPPRSAFIGLSEPGDGLFEYQIVCRSVEDYARDLFEFLRECDRRDLRTVFCERPDPSGLGLTIIDRLTRAAAR
jgi:L-threonylcarbamoyladenylate synthase